MSPRGRPPDRTIYLVRHAIAATRGPDWPDDDQRPVTHRGAARMRQVVKGLDALGVKVDVVATSPLARADQTARLLASGLGVAGDPLVVPELAPGMDAAVTAAALARIDAATMAVVGHEPDLGQLAAWLIGAASPLEFKKGGVCRLDARELRRPRSAALIWLATPKMLRALARAADQ
ncbi:MAG TPA: phosphohistidine phosphatase SixA [Vicinamibacterales bacterium]|nr:phosphohistidine phosphatase SixA [Vicinamibacterales bacterium]